MAEKSLSAYRKLMNHSPGRPDYTTNSNDITQKQRSLSPYLQFKTQRPDHTTYSQDIISETPYNGCPIRYRQVEPTDPKYKLPQYKGAQLPEMRQLYDFECKDIVGTQAVSSLYNKATKKIPEIRNLTLDIKDINAVQPYNVSVIHPRDPDMNLNVSDINGHVTYLQRANDTDPLNPSYDYPNAEQMLEPKTYNQFYDRSPLVYDNQLRTDDIDGLLKEKLTKSKFVYGRRQQLIDIMKTDDIYQKKQINYENRNKVYAYKTTSIQSADQVGQEYQKIEDTGKIKSHEQFTNKTYSNPVFMETCTYRDPEGAPGIKTGYLIPNDKQEKSPGRYDVPEYIPPHAATLKVIRYKRGEDPSKIPSAGLNMHGLENAIKPECTGMLPGPSPDHYQPRSFKHAHDPECYTVPDVFDWEEAFGEKKTFKKSIKIGQIPENAMVRPCQSNKLQLAKLSKTVAPRVFTGQFTLRSQCPLSPSNKERTLPIERNVVSQLGRKKVLLDPHELERCEEAHQVAQLPW